MRLRSTTLPVLLLATLATALGARGARDGAAEAPLAGIAAAAQATPGSRMEGEEALRDAIAGAVTAALVEQFPGQRVELQLHSLDAAAVSVRDREVHGDGRMRFDGDGDWLPFGFRALYDTQAGVALSPRLTLGASGAEAAGAGQPLSPDIAAAFDAEAMRRLAGEFAGQPVALKMESAQGTALGDRYLRIDGAATADFGREGATPARVGALYDRRDGRWVQFAYELGPSATASAPAVEQGVAAGH